MENNDVTVVPGILEALKAQLKKSTQESYVAFRLAQ